MVRTDHSLPVRIIRFMQCHHTPSPTAEHSAFLLPACIVLWTDVITGIPLAVVAKLRARHLFPTSSLSKNKWNSFCYDLHVWFAFHSYFNKQNCNNLCQRKENLTQQRQHGQRQHWSWFQVFAQENGFKVPLPQKFVIWKYFTSQKLMRFNSIWNSKCAIHRTNYNEQLLPVHKKNLWASKLTALGNPSPYEPSC